MNVYFPLLRHRYVAMMSQQHKGLLELLQLLFNGNFDGLTGEKKNHKSNKLNVKSQTVTQQNKSG